MDAETKRITQSDLSEFTGTINYYKQFTRLLITDGVHYLAENAQCWWLIDAIGSYYITKIKRDEYLNSFCIWKFTKQPDGKWLLSCQGDSEEPNAIEQTIEFTDFDQYCDMEEVKFFQCNGVLMLPSEY